MFDKYAQFYSLIYKDKNYQKEADFVYKWANKPKNILELGCGLGQHAKYWAKNGSTILGIDQSDYMIENAYKHKNINYLNQDITKFLNQWIVMCDGVTNTFECVMAMFNVMGYVELEEILPLLPLEKGCFFVFDCWLAKKFITQPPQVRFKSLGNSYKVSVPEFVSKRILKIDFIINESNNIVAYERHFVKGYYIKDIDKLCKKYGYKISDIEPTNTWTCWFKLEKL